MDERTQRQSYTYMLPVYTYDQDKFRNMPIWQIKFGIVTFNFLTRLFIVKAEDQMTIMGLVWVSILPGIPKNS